MRANSLQITATAISLLALSACGAGAPGSDTAANPSTPSASGAVIAAMNNPLQRTPAGFYTIGQNTGDAHDYLHVRSDQVMAGATVSYDISTNDANQALLMSTAVASSTAPTMQFVSGDETDWYYENTWSKKEPTENHSHFLSVRVFKSTAIDRSVFDKNNPGSLLAVVHRLPVTSQEARFVSEYLWTFSMHNNTGHIVLNSFSDQATSSGVRHTIREAVYNPAAMQNNTCETVEVRDYHYDINSVNGGVQLSQSVHDQLRVRLDATAGYVACQ